MLTRRTALGAMIGLVAVRGAQAQSFPSRPITIVVPYPAGGPVDVTARLIAQSVGSTLGQPMTVDNRGGGAGVIGSVAVQHAEPDGHTLILGTNQTHATNQSLLKNCPYDAVKDFSAVAGIADIPHVLVVRRGLDAENVGALISLARKSPGALNYASTGVGSASHLAAELFKTRAGVNLQHIPFRGSAPMTTELLAGRIDLTFATLPSVISHIDTGAVRALAVASARRASRLPNLPTLAEAGVPGYEATIWIGVMAPAGTPRGIVDTLNREINKILSRPEIKESWRRQGTNTMVMTPEEFGRYIEAEIERWAKLIKANNIGVN